MSFVVQESAVIFGERIILVYRHQLEVIAGGETLLRANQFKAKSLRPMAETECQRRGISP
ncbi:protein of unknown function [Methylorubrum extorquens]|uniref:Uncharacterized protein n=1 Tax=Methylorubrum extorquens TaxID=408 RepID=A0A2N9AUJ8_METEX|nr:protein of unknown function [Methylorubrum extorquens]